MHAAYRAVTASSGSVCPAAPNTPHDSYDSALLLLKDAPTCLARDGDSACLCLARALARLRQGEMPSRTEQGHLSNWQVKRLVRHIDDHLGSRIRTAHLAALLHLSVSHFTRVFKTTFGVTPLAYVASRRIDAACRVMLTTDASLTEIAYSHGFCDQSHFIRIFRRQTGITPHALRRLNGAGVWDESCVASLVPASVLDETPAVHNFNTKE